MLPHSSHLLQPLDVGCFSPLKTAYGRQIEKLIRLRINHITTVTLCPGAFASVFGCFCLCFWRHSPSVFFRNSCGAKGAPRFVFDRDSGCPCCKPAAAKNPALLRASCAPTSPTLHDDSLRRFGALKERPRMALLRLVVALRVVCICQVVAFAPFSTHLQIFSSRCCKDSHLKVFFATIYSQLYVRFYGFTFQFCLILIALKINIIIS
jgi:hypothetical protein